MDIFIKTAIFQQNDEYIHQFVGRIYGGEEAAGKGSAVQEDPQGVGWPIFLGFIQKCHPLARVYFYYSN